MPTLPCLSTFPPERHQVSFTSWDRQITFAYYHSERSRYSSAVAYRIAASVTAALAD